MSNFESFTLEHYAAVFEDTRLIVILINTIVVALLSALVSTAIGVLGALPLFSCAIKRCAMQYCHLITF